MPNSPLEIWFCDTIVAGPWPFALLLLPLLGAFFYGREKKKLGWILIGVWLPLQIGLSFANNFLVSCAMDAPPPGFEAPSEPGGATQPDAKPETK
jgi:hypothetical protein